MNMEEAARSVSRSMQLDAAPISCGVHDEIDRRRTKLGQLLPSPRHQCEFCYLRRGIMNNHP